jgi:transposase
MSKQKHYSTDFKLEAAKLVIERGYTYKKAAEQLGINYWTLRDWVRKFREDGVLPSAVETVPTAEELKALRKEIAELRMENQILKKATAYFAKDSL